MWKGSFFFKAAGLKGSLKFFPSLDLSLFLGILDSSAIFFLAFNKSLSSLNSENKTPGIPLDPSLCGLVYIPLFSVKTDPKNQNYFYYVLYQSWFFYQFL